MWDYAATERTGWKRALLNRITQRSHTSFYYEVLFFINCGFTHGKKSTFCFSSAALFPTVLSPVLLGTAIVWLLSGYLRFHPWPRFYCRLGRNVFPPRNFSVFFFLQLFLITLVVVLVWICNTNSSNFILKNKLCIWVFTVVLHLSMHVGILALWVHPGDNIHGYIPLSILVLAGRVAVERWLVGVSHRIGLWLHTPSQPTERKSDEIWEAHSGPCHC